MIEYRVKVYDTGFKYWYLNDKLHREDGPAVEHGSGTKYWYFNGILHREDGPAVDWACGDKEWHLNGKKLTEAEHKAATSKSPCEGKIVEIDGKKYQLKDVS